jgi:hypothetical protein
MLRVFPTARVAGILRGRGNPLICGSGDQAEARVAERIAADRPDLVLLAGVCGGLDPSLGRGAIILARQVGAPGQDLIDPDRFLFDDVRDQLHAKRLPFVASRLVTVEQPAATKAEKCDLWNEHGAGGVDMETYQVARACKAAGVKWLAVRAVVDGAGANLPKALRSWSDETEDRSIVRSAAARPWEWPTYVGLARGERKALRALRTAVPAVFRAARNAKNVETLDLMAV